MSYRAAYLTHDGEARDEVDWTPEFSRRGRGFATYAALRQLGRRGIAELVERTSDHAYALVMGMGGLEGVDVLATSEINQGWCGFWTR